MQVDFNNLRMQLAYAYDKVCVVLNSAIDDEGNINIPAETLQQKMDELRELALVPCHIWQEGDPNFILLSDKLEKANISHFNPEKSED